ncbi:condensation domain-containing protein, partial [Streptomyces hygroscopicus]|uniref:condensation domain-containing protein n=1 Tax=Streptomyces hygroscopicus TaxID=1912 RepID=UPI0036CFBDE7
AVLVGHGLVARAVVVVREDQPGDKRIVAYVIGESGLVVDEVDLRRFCSEALPDYMVPSAFVVLESFPLTPNGKLDREALPVPDFSVAVTAKGREPETDAERVLCELFAEILGLEQVGVDDNFFDLGGHSLLFTRLISRLRSDFDMEITLRTVFEAHTPADLAAHFADHGERRLPLAPRTRGETVLPLSFSQLRFWLQGKLQSGGAQHVITTTLRLSGVLDGQALRAALGDVVGRHEVLRTVFPVADGLPVQRIVATKDALPELPLTTVRDRDALPGLLEAEAIRPIDVSTEPPLRAALFELGPTEHVLALIIHHIAFDGASSVPLARDLSMAYTARCAGEEPSWAALPVQYADYTLWQRELLGDECDEGSLFSRQLAFWRGCLAGMREELVLPWDRARPVVGSGCAGAV